MAEEYGLVEIQPRTEFPLRELLRVPHKDRALIVGFPAFGPNYFSNNVAKMRESYSHPVTGERISFVEPTTSETISVVDYALQNRTIRPKLDVKRTILDPRWAQTGRILRTSEGVFVNPPRDKQGNVIMDAEYLKRLLNGAKPIKIGNANLYVVGDTDQLKDFAYAEYDTFQRGVQDNTTFAQGGLARALEHTEEPKAGKLERIASPELYKNGVNVWGFDPVNTPALRVAVLDSGRVDDWLDVNGCGWYGDYYGGFAFGVLDQSPKATQ